MQIRKNNNGSQDEYEQHVAENIGDYQVKSHKYENAVAKVLSVLTAVVLWFYVVGTNSTIEETVFSGIAVDMNGINQLESELGLSVLNGYDYTVDLTIKGTKSALKTLDAESLSAYVDLGSITEAGDYTLEIGTSLPSGLTLGGMSSNYIQIYVDRRTTVSVPVEVELSSFSLEGTYTLGTPIPSIETVNVTGPAEVLEQIDRAVVRLDLGRVTQTVTSKGVLELVDKEGNRISNPYVKMNTTEVSVRTPVYMEKDIPLTVSYKYGYFNDSNVKISINPQSIRIKGAPEVLRDMESINLLSIDEKKITEQETIQSTAIMMPDDVENLSGIRTAEIKITHKGTQVHSVNVTNIKVNNPNNLDYRLESDSIMVQFRGTVSLLQLLNSENVTATIDLGFLNKASGTASALVNISIVSALQGSVYEIGEYRMNVTIE